MVGGIGGSMPPSYGGYGATDPYGDNQEFVAQIEGVWQEIQAYRNDPSSINIQTLMTTVTSLNAYFTQNGIPPTSDADATDLYNILNGEAPGGESLAQICATGSAGAVAYIQEQFNSKNDLFAGLYNVLNSYGHSSFDQGNTALKTDLQNLMTALNGYNSDPGDYGPLVAKWITQFLADAKSGGVTDGYLTNIVAFLNTSIPTASGSTSLATLAANYASNPSAFQTALNGLVTGSAGADLVWMVENSISYEGWG